MRSAGREAKGKLTGVYDFFLMSLCGKMINVPTFTLLLYVAALRFKKTKQNQESLPSTITGRPYTLAFKNSLLSVSLSIPHHPFPYFPGLPFLPSLFFYFSFFLCYILSQCHTCPLTAMSAASSHETIYDTGSFCPVLTKMMIKLYLCLTIVSPFV